MFLFAGDPHGSFQHLDPFLISDDKGDLPTLFILGDLQLTSPQPLEDVAKKCKDVWFVHGNHDSKTVAAFDAIWGSEWKKHNLHGKVEDIQGVKVAGLGGVFRGKIWMPPNNPMYFDPIHFCQYCPPERLWRNGIPLRHRSTIFPSDVEMLESQSADILLTHEAPKPHPYGFQVINQLAEKMGVKKIFHGHHHENHRYEKNLFPYQITNVGYHSLADLEGNYLLETIDDRHIDKKK